MPGLQSMECSRFGEEFKAFDLDNEKWRLE